MPNQFFSRGYYGYPYPQQNMFPPAADAYSQYPYLNAGMPQMPAQPYMQQPQGDSYANPSAYMPYQQMGYAAPNPYEMPQMANGTMGAMPPQYGAVPSVPPAYAMPLMQPPVYGMNYSQQAYMPAYPGATAYDPQYAAYAEAAQQQYWPGYVGAYAPQYPVENAAYPGYQDPNTAAEYDGAPAPHRKRRGHRKSEQRSQRASRRVENRREAERKKRDAQKQEEALLQQAALREARLNQHKRKAAQEAAHKEAIRQEMARRGALKQKLANQQAALRQNEEKLNAMRAEDDKKLDATAAAAASIAAFHEAAKSVNEINLNQVAQALKPKPEPNVELEDLGVDFITKLDSGKESAKAIEEKVVETGPVSEIKFESGATDIDIPGISKKSVNDNDATKTEEPNVDKKDASDLTAPKAEDVVVVSEEKTEKGEGNAKKADAIEKSTEFLAVEDDAKKEVPDSDKKDDKIAETENVATEDAAKVKDQKSAEDAASDDVQASASKAPLSPLAIIGLVFGIISVILAGVASIWNFLGYAALVIGALAVILSAISLGTMKGGKKSGKPAGILGIICGVLAIVIAIVLHLLMPANSETDSPSYTGVNSSVLAYVVDSSSSASSSATDGASGQYGQTDSATNDSNAPQTTDSSSPATGTNTAGSSSTLGGMSSMDIKPSGAHEDLAVGKPVEYSNGLTVTVDSVKTGLKNSAGKQLVCVTVTYKNGGSTTLDYNSFDWKVQDPDGTLRTYAIYPSGENELNSGELTPGSTVTGNLYFEAPVSKIIYEANYWNSDSNASWNA